jgi:hypothetical protein
MFQRVLRGSVLALLLLALPAWGQVTVPIGGRTVSDTITADEDSVELTLGNAEGAGFTITSMGVATLVPEVTFDGTNWVGHDVYSLAGEAVTRSITANGSFMFQSLAGVQKVRVRADQYTSGTITVFIRATASPGVAMAGAERVPGGTPPNHAVYIGGLEGSTFRAIKTDSTGAVQVDVESLPSVTIGTFPDNEPFNLAQIAGTTTATSNGGVSAGVQRVTIANDSTGILASVGTITTSVTPGTAAGNLGKAEDAQHNSGDTGTFALAVREDTPTASAANADYIAFKTNQFGHLFTATICNDPNLTTSVAISQTALNGNAELVALTSNQTIYICGYNFMTSAAASIRLVYGTGSACATGETGITGAYPMVANQGINAGFGGAIVAKGAVSNAVCIETSASANVHGIMTYAKGQFP